MFIERLSNWIFLFSSLFGVSGQLAEIHRHTWVVAGSAGCRGGELELELPMMSVVQTRILPTEDDCDPDVLQAITSLGCFKDRKKLIQELLNPKSVEIPIVTDFPSFYF